jgi:TonB family protein
VKTARAAHPHFYFKKDIAKTKTGHSNTPTYIACAVNVPPEHPDGQGEMMKVIYDDLKYSKEAAEEKIGRVVIVGAIDVSPEYPGGQGEMMKFIFDNLKYPKEAVEKKIQGRVTVEFIVKADGNIDNVKVQKSVDPLLDAEAVRVIKAMPAWTPGQHKGEAVAVRFFLPIVFQIPKDKEAETK